MIETLTLAVVLKTLGLDVAGHALYDTIKHYLTSTPAPTQAGLEEVLKNSLLLQGTNVQASTVVDVLARNGIISIKGSHIYGPNGVSLASSNGIFSLGDGSTSRTDKTAITTPVGGGIVGTGTSSVVQHEDGSIRFNVGGGGDIRFFVPK